MSIRLVFKCQHSVVIGDGLTAAAPVCGVCGETQVVRTIPTRLPSFTGTVRGPCATYTSLEPGIVNVAPAGPLTLKEDRNHG